MTLEENVLVQLATLRVKLSKNVIAIDRDKSRQASMEARLQRNRHLKRDAGFMSRLAQVRELLRDAKQQQTDIQQQINNLEETTNDEQ